MATTAERLRQIMQARGLRQVDILRMVEPYCADSGLKMSKSDISQFLSGKVQPGQWKLSLLGKALHVNPAWLMGEDVMMEDSQPTAETPAQDDAWAIRDKLRADPELRVLFDAADGAKPEHLRAAVAMLRALKAKEEDNGS